MIVWLEKAGRGALLAAAGTALIYLPGVWEAPNLSDAIGLGVVGLGAIIAAVLLAVKAALPDFSLRSVLPSLPEAWVSRLDLFIATFVGNFIVAVTDLINQSPDLNIGRAAIVAAMTGAVASALRALAAFGTRGETPSPDTGVKSEGYGEEA